MQADLNHRWADMSEGIFSDVADLTFSELQSTLVISNSKGLSEIPRDIRTSTYQICRTEKTNNSNNHI